MAIARPVRDINPCCGDGFRCSDAVELGPGPASPISPHRPGAGCGARPVAGYRCALRSSCWYPGPPPKVRGDLLSGGRLPGGSDREPQPAELAAVVAGHQVLALVRVVIQRMPSIGGLSGPIR